MRQVTGSLVSNGILDENTPNEFASPLNLLISDLANGDRPIKGVREIFCRNLINSIEAMSNTRRRVLNGLNSNEKESNCANMYKFNLKSELFYLINVEIQLHKISLPNAPFTVISADLE
ncbi:unnamed protein product [Rotaria sp. Silwood2]|nr:unnamed protein product [Rotaria sp. Silwood2]